MFRTILCLVVALFVCVNIAEAKGGKKTGNKPVIGTVKSVDAAAGIVTVTVTNKKGSKDKDFTIGDATTVTVTAADGTTKDIPGKDGLKDPVVKEGASVKVTKDETGAVTKVEVGGTYGKKKAPKNQ